MEPHTRGSMTNPKAPPDGGAFFFGNYIPIDSKLSETRRNTLLILNRLQH